MNGDLFRPRLRPHTVRWKLCAIAIAIVFAIVPSPAQSPVYNEPYRPQVQFSPKKNWSNDPNGLVFFEGEYHLFYQYNPFGDTWGHMSWGHAVSLDLLHWRQLPVALPEHDGEMAFTGSVVVDEQNTSGLCKGGRPCLIAVYTGHRGKGKSQREVQNLATSQDRGRTWQFYSKNPVLDRGLADFRDPSVSWMPDTRMWLMAVSLPNDHKVVFYTSHDLKQWTEVSTFGPEGATGGQWECPDLLYVPGKSGSQGIWVLKVGLNPGALQGGSGEQYFLGSFDGKRFVKANGPGTHGWTDYGKDSYCAISFNHLPPHTNPILIGWMNNWQYADKLPTSPWRGQMTIPRRLTVTQDKNGPSLVQEPATDPLRILPANTLESALQGDAISADVLNTELPADLLMVFSPGDSRTIGVRVYSDADHWTEAGYDLQKRTFYVDRVHSGMDVATGFLTRTEAPIAADRPLDLHLVLDRSSIAAFVQGGTITMTNLIFPHGIAARIEFFRKGGEAPVSLKGSAWRLQSIWTSRTRQ